MKRENLSRSLLRYALPFQLSFTPTVFAAAQEEEEVVAQEDMTLIYPTTATAISGLDSSAFQAYGTARA